VSRTSNPRYQRARQRLKRSADGDTCWQCSGFIDQELKWPHPDSWTADHVTQLKDGGSNTGRSCPPTGAATSPAATRSHRRSNTPDSGSWV
jgi:hypothetical protein